MMKLSGGGLRSLQFVHRRFLSTKLDALRRIRNVGIFAHIDAGKTTTSERMLVYSGVVRRPGEVHDGASTMDYLEQEKERGITIGSAAISFSWRDHHINLIDTPGHVDFTMEVERSLRVLDGGIAIFDAVAGVEAQSETVWGQADKYGVPRLVFINKMDREGASFDRSVEMIAKRLGATPLITQIPIGEGSTFSGVIDIVRLKVLTFSEDELGRTVSEKDVNEISNKNLYNDSLQRRNKLLEQLADFDDKFAELYLSSLNEDNEIPLDDKVVTPEVVHTTLRRVTIKNPGVAVPVLCGSSLKNCGVQPLLDAVVRYLPSPSDLPPIVCHDVHTNKKVFRIPGNNDPLAALVFKVQNDARRGLMCFVRVYSGKIERGLPLLNSRTGKKERATRLLRVLADHSNELAEMQEGDIAAIVGLKEARTGDTLLHTNDKHIIRLERVVPPTPVFGVAVEAANASEEKKLEEALAIMLREDPSLSVHNDSDTGQTLIYGMGELHLEIVGARLKRDFKVDVEMGKMRVSYRESIVANVNGSYTYVSNPNSEKKIFASVSVSLSPTNDGENIVKRETFKLYSENGSEIELSLQFEESLMEGVNDGLLRGPLLGYPVIGVKVTRVKATINKNETSTAALKTATIAAMIQALRQTETQLMEPVMELELTAPEKLVGSILSDITSQRRGSISSVEAAPNPGSSVRTIVQAHIPLKELIGYSTKLRSFTAGEAFFSQKFHEYVYVGPTLQKQYISSPP